MMLVQTYVAQSAIQGLGVFAGEFIAKGKLMWQLNPKFDIFVDLGEFETLPQHMRDYLGRYSYPHLEKPGVLVLDCDDGKYMNHSETPNTDFTIFSTGVAVKDIQQGEEITCDYREFDPEFKGFAGDVIASNAARLNAILQK